MKHKWIETSRNRNRTVRRCARCEMFKVSRHEVEAGREIHWVEFWHGSERIVCDATPACVET